MVRDTGTAMLEEIAELEAERGRIEAKIAHRMLDFADLRRNESALEVDSKIAALEASFAADELSLVLKAPTMAVQSRLSQARRVRGRLPQTWLAWRRGTVDAFRVRLIDEAAERLEDSESRVELDDNVTRYAASHTTSQLKAWLRRFVARVEPDKIEQRSKNARADRSVCIDHDVDGVSWINALVGTADASRIDTLLTKLAKTKPAESKPAESKPAESKPAEDARTLAQCRADVFVDLLLGRIDQNGTATGRSHSGAVIGITIPVNSLVGLDESPGESVDHRFTLPADLVRELATEPGTLFYRLLTDPLGNILDVSETGRFPSRQLRSALEMRDGTCAFPSCNVAAVDCDTDHVKPSPRGPTTGNNLKNLCRRHHRMKTFGIVDTTMEPEHRWHLSDGTILDSENQPVAKARLQPETSVLEHKLATFIAKHAG